MTPFPRREMIERGWQPQLIEFFYQLHLSLGSASGDDDNDGGAEAANAAITSILARLNEEQDSGPIPIAPKPDDPEHETGPAMQELSRRIRTLENEVL